MRLLRTHFVPQSLSLGCCIFAFNPKACADTSFEERLTKTASLLHSARKRMAVWTNFWSGSCKKQWWGNKHLPNCGCLRLSGRTPESAEEIELFKPQTKKELQNKKEELRESRLRYLIFDKTTKQKKKEELTSNRIVLRDYAFALQHGRTTGHEEKLFRPKKGGNVVSLFSENWLFSLRSDGVQKSPGLHPRQQTRYT